MSLWRMHRQAKQIRTLRLSTEPTPLQYETSEHRVMQCRTESQQRSHDLTRHQANLQTLLQNPSRAQKRTDSTAKKNPQVLRHQVAIHRGAPVRPQVDLRHATSPTHVPADDARAALVVHAAHGYSPASE